MWCAWEDGGEADEGEQLARQLLEEVELVQELCARNVDVLVDSHQLSLKVGPLLHNVDNLHSLQAFDDQTQIALPSALHAIDLGDTGISKDILFGRLHRIALVHRLVPLVSIVNQQLSVRAKRVGIERHTGHCNSRVWLRGRADAVNLREDGGDIGAVGDGDLECCAREHGEGRRERDEW